jgi:hypothetical protein
MLLDTNAISEAAKNKQGEGKNLIRLMTTENIFPCVSIHSIFEIRKRLDVYEKFLDVFSLVPFLLLKTHQQIFEEEVKKYPTPDLKEIVGFAFSFVNKDPLANTRTFLTKLFSDPEVLRTERAWDKELKIESMNSIISLKKNFSMSRSSSNAFDADRFINESLPQYIIFTIPRWVFADKKRFINLQSNAFPSIIMMLYNVFYRFYDDKRKPEENDIFDMLITSSTPYMDIVVTEGFQAETFRKIRNGDKNDFLRRLEIKTLSYIRN